MSDELQVAAPKSEVAVIFEKITVGLQAFEQRKADLIKLRDDASGIKITTFDDKENLKRATEYRKKLKVERVQIEKEGKMMRDPLTSVNKDISAKEKELVDIIAPTEKDLKSVEDWYEAEQLRIENEEAEKEEKKVQDRINRLAAYGFEIDINMLKGLPDDQFERMEANAKKEFEKEEINRKEQERIAEEERKELAELRRQKVESDRIIKEQQDKIEADRLEKERRDRIEANRAERDADKLRLEQEAEKERLENERIKDEKAKEKVMKDTRFERRKKQLIDMGFVVYNGCDFSLEETWSAYWEQVYSPNDEDFASYVVAIEQAIEDRKFRLEKEANQRAADIEKARQDGIEEAKRLQKEKDAQEAERVAQSSDKDKFAVIVSYLENLPTIEPKSVRHKKLLAEIKELTGKVIAHIKART